MEKIYAYLFEAKAIQSFILDSGKLRDLVGASELVDLLCGHLLTEALAACGLVEAPADADERTIGDAVAFSRRAGGAFYAFSGSQSSIERLATLWPLVVQQHAPGLPFDQGRGLGDTAYAAYRDARGDPETASKNPAASRHGLRQARSQALHEFPQAGPLVLRTQRTGRPATEVRRDPDGEPEPLDARVARQRQALDHGKGSLAAKLGPAGSGLGPEHWPKDMESDGPGAFPFLDENRYIAVVHADGNGLGQLLLDLEEYVREQAPGAYLQIFRQLSEGIEVATRGAAQEAVRAHLLGGRDWRGMVPARPIVLGGDDLTMIVRADLALAFVRTFLAEFEERTRGPMDALQTRGLRVPDRLTACAGIAYIKAGQPFYLGANLAEGVTAAVKSQVKKIDQRTPPGSLAWHRVTTAMIDDYENTLDRDLTVGPKGGRYRHTLGAYSVRREDRRGLPALDDMLDLQRLFEMSDMARGPSRQLLTMLDRQEAQAIALYRRWRNLMQDPANGKEESFKEFYRATEALLGAKPGDLPYRQAQGTDADFDWEGPLGDLHALMAVKSRAEKPKIRAAAKEDHP